jgi:hypothetical protein
MKRLSGYHVTPPKFDPGSPEYEKENITRLLLKHELIETVRGHEVCT